MYWFEFSMGLVSACRLTLTDWQTFSSSQFPAENAWTDQVFHIYENLRPCVTTSPRFSRIRNINACGGSVEITGKPVGRVRYNVDKFSVTTCTLKKMCVITFKNVCKFSSYLWKTLSMSRSWSSPYILFSFFLH